jgi:hypothetical protein
VPDLERIEETSGHVFYRIWSDYAKSSLAIEPTELLNLLALLSDNGETIRLDAQTNHLHSEKPAKEVGYKPRRRNP